MNASSDLEKTENLLEEDRKKHFWQKPFFYILIILILLIVMGVGYFLFLKKETPVINDPTISLVSGTYSEPQEVNFSNVATGVDVYYTTDGSTPTKESNKYTPNQGIPINESLLLKAKAFGVNGGESEVVSASYQISDKSDSKQETVPSNTNSTFNLKASVSPDTEFGYSGIMDSFKVSASSYLITKNMEYPESNVIDGNLSTGWCEGSNKNGIGEWISFENTGGTTEVDSITLVVGYAQSAETFELNTIPVVFEVQKNGANLGTITLTKTMEPQQVIFNEPIILNSGDTLTLDVQDVVVGANDTALDMFITEIQFN